jgi:hypothetical protein
MDDDSFKEKIAMNLVEMRPSANKAEALIAAGTDDFWGEFLIAPVYHSRYANINRDCYDNNDYCLLGCNLNWSCIPYTETEDLKSVSEITPVSEKAETYLRKAIELCQKNNIDILLTNTPTPCTTADQQTYYNYVAAYIQSLADDAECVNFLFFNGDKNSLSSEVSDILNAVGIELNEPGIVVFQGDTIFYQGKLRNSYEYVTYLDKYIFSAEGNGTDQTLYVDREKVGTISTDGDPELYIFTYNAIIGAGYSYGKEL